MQLIVAVDEEWGIGYKGDLLVRLRGDLSNFKKITEGKNVILGSNTLSTFPGGKPLPKRTNIVLHPDASYKPEGVTVVHSLEELFVYVENRPEEEFIVIGGASVYRQLLPYCDAAYITKIAKTFPKDVWFENLDERPEWKCTFRSKEFESDIEKDGVEGLRYRFCVYKRIKTGA